MGKFFNLESPFMRALSRMADIMILNFLVLITCIPIITIGASLSAMHYVLIKMVRDEETYIMKMYFKSFKENFLQGTLLWLIEVFALIIFGADYYLFFKASVQFPTVVVILILALGVFFLMTYMYVYPLQARFVNSVGKTIKNAFFIMILNFPKSILMVIVYLMPVALVLLSSYAVPFLIMFGVSGPGLAAAYLYKKVFMRFEPEAEAITSDMDFKVATDDTVEDDNMVASDNMVATDDAEQKEE